jgi:hypothetical protein
MPSSSEDRHRTVHQLQTSPRPTRKPLGELAELAFKGYAAAQRGELIDADAARSRLKELKQVRADKTQRG